MTEPAILSNPNLRPRAFLIHLAISLGLLAAALGMILWRWYPGQFIVAGGLEGLALLAGVTLVLGPLLTYVAFTPGKRTLLIKLDLAIIAVVQTACMAFGLWTIHQQRPVLQVLTDDRIHVVSASELAAHRIDLTSLGLADAAPHQVLVDLPTGDPAQLAQLKMLLELVDRKPPYLARHLYLVAADHPAETVARVAYIRERLPPSTLEQIQGLVQRQDCTWLPLSSVHTEGFGCYDHRRGVLAITRR